MIHYSCHAGVLDNERVDMRVSQASIVETFIKITYDIIRTIYERLLVEDMIPEETASSRTMMMKIVM